MSCLHINLTVKTYDMLNSIQFYRNSFVIEVQSKVNWDLYPALKVGSILAYRNVCTKTY